MNRRFFCYLTFCSLFYQLFIPEGEADEQESVLEAPEICRTVLTIPQLGQFPHSIAVKLPGGHNFSFDTEKCIMIYLHTLHQIGKASF